MFDNRFSASNSGTTTPQDVGLRSMENSDTENDDSFRYDSGHIALDYGTGTSLFQRFIMYAVKSEYEYILSLNLLSIFLIFQLYFISQCVN